MYDPSPGIVESLEPLTRARAIYLLNAFRAAGVPLIATSGRRGYFEQAYLVATGKSRTLTSKHLAGKAFDVDIAGWSRDAVPPAFWTILKSYSAQLGLVNPVFSWDKGHLESP